MDRKEQLKSLIKVNSELVDNLIDDAIFLEGQLNYYRSLPQLNVNPNNPAQQKATPASKLYKESLQQYTNVIKVLASCTGDNLDEFKDANTHYNPEKCLHPNHAGDMPVLFENNGYAYMSFLTNRFMVKDIIGKVVIIHNMPDDFRTNPGGDSGEKIACGKIVQK